jgi:hypothetical protein
MFALSACHPPIERAAMALKCGDDGLSLRAILPGRRDLIPTGGEPFLQNLDLAAPVARSKACVSIDGARLSMR